MITTSFQSLPSSRIAHDPQFGTSRVRRAVTVALLTTAGVIGVAVPAIESSHHSSGGGDSYSSTGTPSPNGTTSQPSAKPSDSASAKPSDNASTSTTATKPKAKASSPTDIPTTPFASPSTEATTTQPQKPPTTQTPPSTDYGTKVSLNDVIKVLQEHSGYQGTENKDKDFSKGSTEITFGDLAAVKDWHDNTAQGQKLDPNVEAVIEKLEYFSQKNAIDGVPASFKVSKLKELAGHDGQSSNITIGTPDSDIESGDQLFQN